MAWVRSHNKAVLVWADRFSVEDNRLTANDIYIGWFKYEEAALVELDSIQRWIEAGAPGVYQVSDARPE